MRSPVRGLTPARAPRSLTWNLPNPDTVTSLPRRSASSTVASTASTARGGILLGQIGAIGHLVDQLGLCHFALLVRETVATKLTPRADGRIRKNTPMAITRIAWLVTVLVALITALLLALSGYTGYAGLGVAVAVSAAINLL